MTFIYLVQLAFAVATLIMLALVFQDVFAGHAKKLRIAGELAILVLLIISTVALGIRPPAPPAYGSSSTSQ